VEAKELARPKEYPWRMIVPVSRTEPMDRKAADAAALDFAVGLMRDTLKGGVPPNKTGGKKSFELWARLLRDNDHWGAHFYHANVVGHLLLNRRSAAPYLRAVAERHDRSAASHLEAAAAAFENGRTRMSEADTSKDALESRSGRENLARLIDEMARLETDAATHMESARTAMP
jgi:hypothetical protein